SSPPWSATGRPGKASMRRHDTAHTMLTINGKRPGPGPNTVQVSSNEACQSATALTAARGSAASRILAALIGGCSALLRQSRVLDDLRQERRCCLEGLGQACRIEGVRHGADGFQRLDDIGRLGGLEDEPFQLRPYGGVDAGRRAVAQRHLVGDIVAQ